MLSGTIRINSDTFQMEFPTDKYFLTVRNKYASVSFKKVACVIAEIKLIYRERRKT